MQKGLISNSKPLPKGTTLMDGQLVVKRTLEKGGNSFIYLVEDTTKSLIVIKEFCYHSFAHRGNDSKIILFDTEKTKEIKKAFSLFKHEFWAHQTISNNNKYSIPSIRVDIFEENSTIYYGMQYIEGKTLFEIVKSKGLLSEQKVLLYIEKLINIIMSIHSKDWLFLDISPKNIIITEAEDLFLIDFGNARSIHENYNLPLSVSEGFSAPEVNQQEEISYSADYYSIGALLFYSLTGGYISEHSLTRNIINILRSFCVSKKTTKLILGLIDNDLEIRALTFKKKLFKKLGYFLPTK